MRNSLSACRTRVYDLQCIEVDPDDGWRKTEDGAYRPSQLKPRAQGQGRAATVPLAPDSGGDGCSEALQINLLRPRSRRRCAIMVAATSLAWQD